MKKPADKKITVLPEQAGMRVSAFLAPLFNSRSQAEKAIKGSLIYRSVINKSYDKVTKPSYKVRAGESYYIIGSAGEVFQHKSTNWPVYNVPVPILFEDEHLLVINKPTGLPVHPSAGHAHDTLIHALIHRTTLSPGSDPLRPGLVHRLDKDVSGLMVLSKSKKAEELLIEQFKSKKVHRIYRALAVGKQPALNHKGQKAQLIFPKPDPSLKHLPSKPANMFSIVSFIGRHPKNRKKFYSFKNKVAGAKKAITHCRVLKSFQDKVHHIECRLETGRTHQIRVHLKSQGLPILQDPIYSPCKAGSQTARKAGDRVLPHSIGCDSEPSHAPKTESQTDRVTNRRDQLHQIALYSAELKFVHPINNKPLHFKLPWPKEFHPQLKDFNFTL